MRPVMSSVCLFLRRRWRAVCVIHGNECSVISCLGWSKAVSRELISNDNGISNENFKKVIGLLRKTTNLHIHHSFSYISLLSLHDNDMKMPNCKFYGGCKQAIKSFFLFLNLSEVSKNSTPWKFVYIWHFQRIRINVTEFEKKANSF